MFDEIGAGVFRRRYESLDLNVGVVLGDEGLMVIDTRATHSEAQQLIAEMRGVWDLPVRWVVNTHWHWDHVFGNALFDDAEIWGHERCLEPLVSRAEEMKASARSWLPKSMHAEIDGVEIVPPRRTLSDRVTVDIGRNVQLTYHGLAHTDADIVVRVPDAGVAFMGDMIEEGAPPNFGDSHPLNWPVTLASAMEQPMPFYVPGHGDVVDPAFVDGQLDELSAVASLGERLRSGEISAEFAAASGPYPSDVMQSAMSRVPG